MPHTHQNHQGATCDQRLSCVASLVRGFIHETNNAIGAIFNNCDCMDAAATSGPAATSHVENIRRSAQRLDTLTTILQYYTRDMTVPVEAVNSTQLLQDICGHFQANNDPTDVQLETQIPSGIVYLVSNPSLLTDAVEALLHNAMEAYDDPPYPIQLSLLPTPSLALPQPDLSLGCLSSNLSYGCIQISDRGNGIPTSDRCRIFDPFFTTRMRGQGLGLAHVVGLVMHANAYVTFHSRPEAGTTVRLFLPRTS